MKNPFIDKLLYIYKNHIRFLFSIFLQYFWGRLITCTPTPAHMPGRARAPMLHTFGCQLKITFLEAFEYYFSHQWTAFVREHENLTLTTDWQHELSARCVCRRPFFVITKISRCFRGFRLWSNVESFVAGHGACALYLTHVAKTKTVSEPLPTCVALTVLW